MTAGDVTPSLREQRAARRRADMELPKVTRIRPNSGLSPAQVLASQHRRLLDGLTLAVAYHGYEDTKVTDIIELAGVSRPTFYQHFEGKEQCFEAAYGDGVEQFFGAIDAAVCVVSVGLRVGLDFLVASPSLAHLLLVEVHAAAHSARLEHERTLVRLAEALCPPGEDLGAVAIVSEQTTRLLAGGLASHLSGRILAGEVKQLADSHELLLGYLLTPFLSPAATQ